jgi:serine protease AprX
VIGVGGYDTKGTTSLTDDVLGPYTAGIAHSGDRAPDFVAVGSHLQGLRVPNSFLDATHPEGRRGDSYFKDSGTSEAAAIPPAPSP